MNWLSSRNNWLKFKTLGNLPIVLEEFVEYVLDEESETGRCRTCNRLDLLSLGS